MIYDRYAAMLYRYANQRVSREGADGVVAETFLAAFRGRRQYYLSRPDARPWLFGILTRQLATTTAVSGPGTAPLPGPHRQDESIDYDLDELAHAYAMTIHRSQGSEYPAVVIP